MIVGTLSINYLYFSSSMSPSKQKKKNKNISRVKPATETIISRTPGSHKNLERTFLFGSMGLLILFLFSVFGHISYPLFWADESMTAMGTERVLQYGYPKVHDGK